MKFEDLSLAPALLKALSECGYAVPTPIQSQAIPVVLDGHDLIASAQTGTGKTAAFILPALQRMSSPAVARGRGPRILVLTPTRELAGQVNDAARAYSRYLRLKSFTILGGMPYGDQLRALSQPLDLVVATPGRLGDLLDRGRVDLSRVELLILDEADRMLDMGFIEDVEKIAAATPSGRQTLLFSATIDARIEKLASGLLKEPRLIQIAPEQVTHVEIDQRLLVVDDLSHKNRLLHHLVSTDELTKAIIFSATKRDADALARELSAMGHRAAALHGDMKQHARNRTISEMRKGRVRLLVATDVAARGIDVTGVSHVINFDLPKFAEDYVHRIGRTGRAGASGVAISFASRHDVPCLERIERFTGREIPRHEIEGFEATRPLRVSSRGKGGGQGGKKPYKGGSPAGRSSSPARKVPARRFDSVQVEYRGGRRAVGDKRQG